MGTGKQSQQDMAEAPGAAWPWSCGLQSSKGERELPHSTCQLSEQNAQKTRTPSSSFSNGTIRMRQVRHKECLLCPMFHP